MIHGPLSEVLLDGRYRVGEIIGSGGFGTVYAAMHLGLSARVAIKVPRVDDLAPSAIPGAIATFLEEGRTLARLRHPGLVAALDVALLPPDAEGISLPYLVLEWCDGPTLKEWRSKRPGPMAPDEAWELLRPAFAAIAYAHGAGVAHRDIKPANILIETPRGRTPVPRVIDFGIAKILGGEAGTSGATRTTSNERAFTPRYAAPEQLTGLRSGPATDVFALALVLIETLRGAPVFATDDDARQAVLDGDLPTPQKLGLDLGSWNEPIQRALSMKPAHRQRDADAFMRALDEALPGAHDTLRPSPALPVPHLPEPTPQPIPASGRRTADDDSVVPSSHTLRTLGTPRTAPTTTKPVRKARRTASAIVAGVSILAGLGSIVLFELGGLTAIRRSTSSPAASIPEPTPTASADTRRALLDPSPEELIDRAAAGGLPDCKVSAASSAHVDIVCPSGRILRNSRLDAAPIGPERMWALMERDASFVIGDGRAARFTIDGETGLLIAAPGPVVAAVTSRLLDGLRHEPVREPVPPPPPARIPERLAEWKGPELATRIRAMGGIVQEDMPVLNLRTVLYRLHGKDALAVWHWIDPGEADSFLPGVRPPYAYAVDGEIAIVSTGDDELSKLAHLKQILGTTAATRMVETPRATP